MNYYDFHIHSAFSEGESTIEQIAKRAKVLGFKGICFAEYFKNENQIDQLKQEIKKISQNEKINIYLGFEARSITELKKLKDIRKKYDVLLVRGGIPELNRKAVETKQVDILTHPELDQRDSGLNHILAKLAHKNNVAIEINFRQILQSYKGTRSHILEKMKTNIRLCKKYKAPIIICSGAISHLQLKDPFILISMLTLLGLEIKEAKKAISETPENIIRMIKKRQNKKWIMPGVEVE